MYAYLSYVSNAHMGHFENTLSRFGFGNIFLQYHGTDWGVARSQGYEDLDS